MEESDGLKLISLNIEGSKHLDLFLPFLEKEQPDIVCLQELFESDIQIIKERLNMDAIFSPHCYYSGYNEKTKPELWGIGIFSNKTMQNKKATYYVGDENSLPTHIRKDASTVYYSFLSAEILKNNQVFNVGTTHFVWTPDGEPSENQRSAIVKLLKITDSYSEIIIAGDFNAARGGEIFEKIAAKYKDNIPEEYKTSIDGNIHRVGPLPYMVDGLFTTPGYIAENTKLVDGVSDHMAIVSHIKKA